MRANSSKRWSDAISAHVFNLKRNDKIGDVLLEVNNLVTYDVKDVSFKLHKGEVLGFAGLIGSGRTELMRAIFGADPILSGEIKIEGRPVRFRSPSEAVENGIALCPEDRKEQGLVLKRSILENVRIQVLKKVRKGLFLNRKTEFDLAKSAVKRYSIKTPSVEKRVMELSKPAESHSRPLTSEKIVTKILILDEPTKGIDVGTKAEVYQMVCDFARQGIGVIFISSELTEVLNVSDVIMVMHNGRISGSVTREEATEELVLQLAMKD